MNYLFEVKNILKRCTWAKLVPSIKAASLIIGIMILASLFYFCFDWCFQFFIAKF
jgi:preprotein translocase subunit SecE